MNIRCTPLGAKWVIKAADISNYMNVGIIKHQLAVQTCFAYTYARGYLYKQGAFMTAEITLVIKKLTCAFQWDFKEPFFFTIT